MAPQLQDPELVTANRSLTLFDLLRCSGFSASPEQRKLHLAVHNGIDNPLDVFLAGGFQEWQEFQTKRNFEREFVVSLIRLPGKDLWLFAGCFRVLSCGDGDETARGCRRAVLSRKLDLTLSSNPSVAEVVAG